MTGAASVVIFKGAGFAVYWLGALMRNCLQRLYGRGDLHFVTFSCYQRRPFLGRPRARFLFVKILDQVRRRHAFLLIGYVVMPEHVHLLIGEPRKGNPSKVLQVLKQKVSRSLRRPARKPWTQLSLAFATLNDSPAFWQRRFYFTVRKRKPGHFGRNDKAKEGGHRWVAWSHRFG